MLALPWVKRHLRRQIRMERSWADWITFIRTYHRSLPLPRPIRRRYKCRLLQIDSEMIALLDLIASLRPSRVLEIGTAQGGTLFLLARSAAPDAQLISIDLPHHRKRRPPWRDHLYRSFAAPGQSIEPVRMNSHDPTCPTRIRSLLSGDPLDLLFIDGDHSLEGVQADYETFAPLVRSGGLIVFHDVQPDHQTLYGPEFYEGNDAGEVYKLWDSLRQSDLNTEEIIESRTQDGYGFGLVWT